MKLIVSVVVLGLALGIYAAWGREWLKSKPWAAGFFAAIEPLELALYKKSETILFARIKILSGLLLTLLTQLGTIDLTPLMPIIPDKHRGLVQILFNMLPMAVTLVGFMDERLRNTTTKPLELVALPDNKPLPPAVADAVAIAEQAKIEAVAEVKASA